MRIVTTVAVVLCCSSLLLHTQTASIGMRGGYLHVSNESTIPVILGSNDPDCGAFSNGVSPGLYVGLTGDYAIFGDALEFGAGITFQQRPAQLTVSTQAGFEVLDPVSQKYVPLVRENLFESTLGYVAFEVHVRSRPLQDVPIFIRASFDAGNPLVDKSYSQTEQIVSPEGVLFPDGRQVRTTGQGTFPGLGTSMGVGGGIGFVYDLTQEVEIAPEVSYRYGLNSLTTSTTWNQSWIGAGIAIRYRMRESEEPPPPPAPPPPPPPPIAEVVSEPEPAPAVIASLSTMPLEIRETVVTQTFPLLPYLFFDSASAVLPAKYGFTDQTSTFDEKGLPKETLPIYYRILDIVGARMRSNSKGKLVITGTTDVAEGASGDERSSIAVARAQTVADYLRGRWNVAADRLVVRTAGKPLNPSRESYAEGAAENRRVELSSTDESLLGPILHTRFNEYVPVQSRHDFSTTIRNPERAERWKLSVVHDGKPIGSRQGKLLPPETLTFDLSQEMTNQLGPVTGTIDTLVATLEVEQVDREPAVATKEFSLRKTVSNYEVSRLSLIVFDYDRSDISEQNREMMERVVKSATGQGSTARIVGTTDKLGERDHNMQLSQDRAKSVESFVRSIAPSLDIQEVRGIGPDQLPYDNSIPEGRFYCRTVSLQITTPLRVR
ncbi:MAG: OmpA family protein [Ignavibacteria bacterium]|jgi:outer membrane protein OmpA-like peptidoglycan-associated protein